MEFVYAVLWKRSVSYCFTIFTCDVQHHKFLLFILFNTISCYKCFGHCWRKCRFLSSILFGILLSYIWFFVCGVTWRRGRFLDFCEAVSCTFNELLTVPWFILFWFLARKFPVIRRYGYWFMMNLCQFQPFVWARPKYQQLQSLQQI